MAFHATPSGASVRRRFICRMNGRVPSTRAPREPTRGRAAGNHNPQRLSPRTCRGHRSKKIYFFSQRDAMSPAAPTTARIDVEHSGESSHPDWAFAIPLNATNMTAMMQSLNFTSSPQAITYTVWRTQYSKIANRERCGWSSD